MLPLSILRPTFAISRLPATTHAPLPVMKFIPRINEEHSSFKFRARNFSNFTTETSQFSLIPAYLGAITSILIFYLSVTENDEPSRRLEKCRSNYAKLLEFDQKKYDILRQLSYSYRIVPKYYFQFDQLSNTEFEDLCLFMIDRKTGLDFKDILGQTALLYSIKSINRSLTLQLLNNGASKDCFKAFNFKNLTSAEFKWLVCVMIEHKFDLELKDCKGRTVLFYAAQKGKANLVKELLARGANPKCENESGDTLSDYTLRNFTKASDVMKRFT